MKYIRTKDDIQAFNFYCDLWCVYPAIGGINIADTIEELCDVYVIKGVFGMFLVHIDELDKHAMGQTKEMLLSGQLEAYGAIWIIDSNGVPTLKSVAKMNNKGDLELL